MGRNCTLFVGRSRSSSEASFRARTESSQRRYPSFSHASKLLPGAGAGTSLRDERRLVAAERSGAERIILIHPFGPAHMLEDIGDRAAACARRGCPIFLAKIMEVGKQRMRRVAVERLLDQPGKRIDGIREVETPISNAQEIPKIYLSRKTLRNLPCGIVTLKQLLKVWQFFVERLQTRGGHRKQLAPMRAGIERAQAPLRSWAIPS